MPIVQVQAQLSMNELLSAVSQLSKADLERFMSQALALRAQRQAPSLPRGEAELLLKINQGIPPEVQSRYDVLIVKRQTETLSSDEYAELLRLTDLIENLEAQRMTHLAELAQLRQITLVNLMKQLSIPSPTYA